MEEIIKKYLQDRAASDPIIAANLKKQNKSIKECCKYITNQARKQAQNNCAMIEDDVVYGWAIHYFDEDNLPDDNKPSPVAKVITPKQQPKQEPHKPKTIQFDLFADFDDVEKDEEDRQESNVVSIDLFS